MEPFEVRGVLIWTSFLLAGTGSLPCEKGWEGFFAWDLVFSHNFEGSLKVVAFGGGSYIYCLVAQPLFAQFIRWVPR